jgi:two-component system response regulator
MEPYVLLVEDNIDDQELLLRAFRRNRIEHKVRVAHDGLEACDILFEDTEAGTPILVLLDLNLPRMNGIDVLRRIRQNERTSLLPVVVLSSSREQEDVVRSYSLGANSYVRKPVDFSEFVETTRQLGQYWLKINQPPPEGEYAALRKELVPAAEEE